MPGVSSKCHRVSLSTQTICGTPGKEQKAGLDSGRKLKTSSWGGRARTAHLPVRVFPHLARLCHLARGSASSGLRTPSMQDHSSEWGSRCRYPGKGQSPGSEGSTSILSNPRAFNHPSVFHHPNPSPWGFRAGRSKRELDRHTGLQMGKCASQAGCECASGHTT